VKSLLAWVLLMLGFAARLGAQSQAKPPASTPSLGELARRLKAERGPQAAEPAKVYTNDNIPHRGGITVIGPLPSDSEQEELDRPGHIREERSEAAKDAFKREQPCPATGKGSGPCPGYVIDHIVPLACGGPDAPSNMQWQTVAEGKAKDLWERKDCGK
jgi:hypothetical protein